MGRRGDFRRGVDNRQLSAEDQELRRRKQEEVSRIKEGKYHQEERWQRILSKVEKRKEKRFIEREHRLRNTTTFFVSNLPEGCSKERLWDAFQHLENLEDAVVPSKRDGAGNKFGFIRLSKAWDVDKWLVRLKEVKIDGAIVEIDVAKFNRYGSKASGSSRGPISVFNRLGDGHKPSEERAYRQVPAERKVASKPNSFLGALNGSKERVLQSNVIELPPMDTQAKRTWEFRSLIGEAKELETLNNLKSLLSGIKDKCPVLRYLGGLKVLLTFKDQAEANEFLRDQAETWSEWFSRVYVWEGIPPVFERIAWIRVIGVPVCLWDRNVFTRIAERCGRVLVGSEAQLEDDNLAVDRMAILVQSGKRVSNEILMSWKEHEFKVWVEEIDGCWCPSFLDEQFTPSPDIASPVVVSTEVSSRRRDMNRCYREEERLGMGNVHDGMHGAPSMCMENLNDFSSPKTDEHVQEELLGDLDSLQKSIPNEREDVGHVSGIVQEEEQDGPCTINTRPSYITCRPKRGNKLKKKVQNFIIPDLNQEPEISNTSDPFNLEEIFRLEKEVNRMRETVPSCSIHREASEEIVGEEQVGLNFEEEVSRTLEFGVCLGIGVDGFENHVKKLICGEMEMNRDQ
ncbi:putative RNA recognition motif domain, nucleotide-binding alpha-beta plait domain superfamily [Helianthus annuus]|uniref:uncharacterized protein LOC110895968 isoform X1 n=1 Tax=Helianthus annuus TaxID=4232 RepID=UPI000B8FFB8D|nr:uncharacterized protein LOC110895968 isoform X1 [Helianthus annuus]KAJ0868316.1 putative RNA recognition motif domain, nucleotide-binding alpha-beta plait domain superfamily [Helianthus annuus]